MKNMKNGGKIMELSEIKEKFDLKFYQEIDGKVEELPEGYQPLLIYPEKLDDFYEKNYEYIIPSRYGDIRIFSRTVKKGQ